MLLAMTALAQVWYDKLFLGGIASLAVCVILYLAWLSFREKRQQRKDEEERRRKRLSHWGHES